MNTVALREADCYWCVGLPSGKEVYVHAETPEIASSGALLFRRNDGKGLSYIPLAFAPGNWAFVFSASVIDGSPVAVDHWEGQITE